MGSGRIKKVFFKIIDELRQHHPLSLLLHHAQVSRAGYYKWKRSVSRESKDTIFESHIKAIHSTRQFYGYRRVAEALKREGLMVNHKRVLRLMRKLSLRSTIRKKRNYHGVRGSNMFPNLLNRSFSSPVPGKKYVTDITYLPTLDGFIYLSAIQDLYNNEIVSHSISNRNDLALVLQSLDRFFPIKNGIIHSDQGVQYTSFEYKKRLEDLNIQGSHSRKANCLDNACIESFFSHLKTEVFVGKKLFNASETIKMVEEYISFYNEERFQKRLGQRSPVEYRKKLAA